MEQPQHHDHDAILASLEDGNPGPDRAKRLAVLDELIERDADIAERLAGLDRDRLANTPLPDLSVIRQSGPFPSVDAFYRSSFVQFSELLRHAGLRPTDSVLDYGCGLGRVALPLAAYLGPDAHYCGIDTNGACIELNRRRFADLERFRFEHVDLFSSMYNPEGGSIDQLETLDLGRRFDVACLFSVYTHILSDDCAPLARFLARHVEPGGTLLSTWFLLDEDTYSAIDDGKSLHSFRHRLGDALVQNPDKPEGAVAYEVEIARARLDDAGFDVEEVLLGRWRGDRQAPNGQDIIVARRR